MELHESITLVAALNTQEMNLNMFLFTSADKILICTVISLVSPAPCLPLVLCWKGQCPWNYLRVNVVFLEAELCTLHLFSLFLIQKHHRNSLLPPREIICKLFLIYMASHYSSPAAWSLRVRADKHLECLHLLSPLWVQHDRAVPWEGEAVGRAAWPAEEVQLDRLNFIAFRRLNILLSVKRGS